MLPVPSSRTWAAIDWSAAGPLRPLSWLFIVGADRARKKAAGCVTHPVWRRASINRFLNVTRLDENRASNQPLSTCKAVLAAPRLQRLRRSVGDAAGHHAGISDWWMRGGQWPSFGGELPRRTSLSQRADKGTTVETGTTRKKLGLEMAARALIWPLARRRWNRPTGRYTESEPGLGETPTAASNSRLTAGFRLARNYC